MNEMDFRCGLHTMSLSRKVVSDLVSRVKRVERVLGIDIDEEYEKDKCKRVMNFFIGGVNVEQEWGNEVGEIKNRIYKYAVVKYINVKDLMELKR